MASERKHFERLDVGQVHADDVTDEDQSHLRVPHLPRIQKYGASKPLGAAKQIPAAGEGIGDHAQHLDALRHELGVVVRHVVDESDGHQREGKAQCQRVQGHAAVGDGLCDPQQEEINGQVCQWQQKQHRGLPRQVNIQPKRIWLRHDGGERGINALPKHPHPGRGLMGPIEGSRGNHE